MLQLNIAELLRFFDEAPPESTSHATAIVAVLGEDLGAALLKRRFEEDGILTHVHLCPNERPLIPKTKGCWLDRWVLSDGPENPRQYQVEIKNWSACALNGQPFVIPMDAPDYEPGLRNHRRQRWECTFSEQRQSFWNPTANKVLTRMMNAPRPDVEVEPLICFWDPMHPEGDAESLFQVDLQPNANGFGFGHFWVFSMSNYLRGLADDQIWLDMPSATQRIQWLENLVLRVPQ